MSRAGNGEPAIYTDQDAAEVVTAEARARALGASVQFRLSCTRAHNFPTQAAARLFQTWLEERYYTVTLIWNGSNLEINYFPRSAISQIRRTS